MSEIYLVVIGIWMLLVLTLLWEISSAVKETKTCIEKIKYILNTSSNL